jgi:hypothetical protein
VKGRTGRTERGDGKDGKGRRKGRKGRTERKEVREEMLQWMKHERCTCVRERGGGGGYNGWTMSYNGWNVTFTTDEMYAGGKGRERGL